MMMKKSNLNFIPNKILRYIRRKDISETKFIKESEILNDPFLIKIKTYVVTKISEEKVTVKELAKELNLSERTVLRKVREKTGKTTVNFINQCKLEHSISLMKQEKDLSISEITYCLGYNNPAYFSKCFKEKFNKTPAEVKNKIN